LRLELRRLTKIHAPRVVALRDLDLDVGAGELVVILGPTGSGKTTLLRLVAGLERPTRGEISIDGVDAKSLSPVKRGVAMILQDAPLYPRHDVLGNLEFGLRARGVPRIERRRRSMEIAELLGIGALIERGPESLSGGERRRVALGRALAVDARLLLLDEPLSSLDTPLRREIANVIRDVHERLGAATLLVTHDAGDAFELADRIVVLRDGAAVRVGTPREVHESPRELFVASFIGQGMNSLAVSVERESETTRLRGPRGSIAIDARAARSLEREGLAAVEIGVRADDAVVVPRSESTDSNESTDSDDGSAGRVPRRIAIPAKLAARRWMPGRSSIACIVDDRPSLPRNVWSIDADGSPIASLAIGDEVSVLIDPARIYLFAPDGRCVLDPSSP
jgi:ABC-type sugar transport system ATPase subunit